MGLTSQQSSALLRISGLVGVASNDECQLTIGFQDVPSNHSRADSFMDVVHRFVVAGS